MMAIEQIFGRARANHEAKRYGEAIKLYQMVLITDPRHLDATYLLGTVYAETGRLEEAKKYLLKAERISPDSPYIKVNLGSIYLKQGEYYAAFATFIKALELKHDLPEARQNLDVVTGLMTDTSESAAADCLEYGLSCITAGRSDDALWILTVGNSFDPENISIRYLKTVLEGNVPDEELQRAFDKLAAESE
jgi:tetratricopeptide (TPR) repeat protein